MLGPERWWTILDLNEAERIFWCFIIMKIEIDMWTNENCPVSINDYYRMKRLWRNYFVDVSFHELQNV